LAAESDTARNLILRQRRHFLFPHDRLFDDRRKLFLRSLGSRFLPRIELGQDFAREKFKRLACMIVLGLTALLDKGNLIDSSKLLRCAARS
jgi:hypothetical protein